jgi:hypothetical protein
MATSYYGSERKVNNLWIMTGENEEEIEKIREYRRDYFSMNYSKKIQKYDTGWITLASASEGVITTYYFTILITNIPKVLIPFLRVVFLYKSEDKWADPFDTDNFIWINRWGIKKISEPEVGEDEEESPICNIHIGGYIQGQYTTYDGKTIILPLSTRIIIQGVNQRRYRELRTDKT